MKKITMCLMTGFLLSATIPIQSKAASNSIPTSIEAPSGTAENTIEVEALLLRLNEINEMDKSDLNSSEKKALRKEVRSIKSGIAQRGGGVYLSVGAVIIIVLLLIILL